MSHGRVRYGPAVSHLDDASRYPDGNGAGRQISDDHAAGSHHASVADRDAGKDDRPRADPDVCADHDVLFDPRLTHDRRSRLIPVVRRGHVHPGTEQRIFAHDDPALAVPGPKGAVLSDV